MNDIGTFYCEKVENRKRIAKGGRTMSDLSKAKALFESFGLRTALHCIGYGGNIHLIVLAGNKHGSFGGEVDICYDKDGKFGYMEVEENVEEYCD